jgi:tRNA-modifying protein YgfZ
MRSQDYGGSVTHAMLHEGYAGYDVARTGAAVGTRGARGWLQVSGPDAVSFLHGVLTNDVASLATGQWRYAAYLTPQGRMISDMRVLRRADHVALETEPEVVAALAARFDASIFTEQIRIVPRWDGTGRLDSSDSSSRAGAQSLVICGPAGRDALASVLGHDEALRRIAAREFLAVEYKGDQMVLTGHEDLDVPAVDVLGSAAVCDRLMDELRDSGVAALGPMAIEALRIEAGTPRFGTDMTTDTIPLEAGIEQRAISMTKGCYVGQEVIIRILHRGHGRVARRLVRLTVDSPVVPPAGSSLDVAGREVGAITSAAYSPRLDRAVALGYIHRDFAESGTAVAVMPTGTRAVVTRD